MVLLIIIPFLKMAISLGVYPTFSDIPNWLRPCQYVVLGAKMKAPWCPEVGIRAVHGPYFAARRSLGSLGDRSAIARESMPRCHWQPLALLNGELSITSYHFSIISYKIYKLKKSHYKIYKSYRFTETSLEVGILNFYRRITQIRG